MLKAASGKESGYVKVVKASKGRYGATHAATETGELACGTKPHTNATITEISRRAQGSDLPHMPQPTRHGRQPTKPTAGSRRSSSSRSRSACAR